MLAALIALTLAYPQQLPGSLKPPAGTAPSYATLDLTSIEDPRLVHTQWIQLAAAEEPQRCPRHPWLFPFVTAGYGRTAASETSANTRFQVFSQYRNETLDNDPSVWTSRLLLRLWDMNLHRLGVDNPERYRRIVDVFLCTEGEPGGEQMFVNADLGTPAQPKLVDMNAIFIYQVQTLTDPGEFVREVSHEFGHATLPQVGPFTGPEPWANGDVGERIYIKWLDDALKSGKLVSSDVAKSTPEHLNKYIRERVDPYIAKLAKYGPDMALLAKDSEDAYHAYVGLTTYAQAILPTKVFGRSMRLIGGNKGSDYARAIVDACAEVPLVEFAVPGSAGKGALWLPVGKGAVETGTVKAKKGAWALVAPAGPTVRVRNPGVKS